MMDKKHRQMDARLVVALVALTGGVVFAGGGCATSAEVSGLSAIATAQYAIRAAENKQAERYAPEQISAAYEKLDLARARVSEGMPNAATQLAEEATVDAQLASAIAERAHAAAQLAEANKVKQDAQKLRRETTEAAEERAR
jgi:hypothetical protein